MPSGRSREYWFVFHHFCIILGWMRGRNWYSGRAGLSTTDISLSKLSFSGWTCPLQSLRNWRTKFCQILACVSIDLLYQRRLLTWQHQGLDSWPQRGWLRSQHSTRWKQIISCHLFSYLNWSDACILSTSRQKLREGIRVFGLGLPSDQCRA